MNTCDHRTKTYPKRTESMCTTTDHDDGCWHIISSRKKNSAKHRSPNSRRRHETSCCDVHRASFTSNRGVPVDPLISTNIIDPSNMIWRNIYYCLAFQNRKVFIPHKHIIHQPKLNISIKTKTKTTTSTTTKTSIKHAFLHQDSVRPINTFPQPNILTNIHAAVVPAPARSSKSNKPRSKVSVPTTPPVTLRATALVRPLSLQTLVPPMLARTLKTTTPALRASRASLCLLSPLMART